MEISCTSEQARHGSQRAAEAGAAPWIELLYACRAMSDPEYRDPFSVETSRLVEALARKVRESGVSVRSLEKKMGVGDSVFSKVLKGKITLQVRHILLICTALGIDWKDFFADVYGLGGSKEPAAPAVAPKLVTEAELDRRVIRLLLRLKVIEPDAVVDLLPDQV
jgi:transcriptional regulator with XRE-family HTH domain